MCYTLTTLFSSLIPKNLTVLSFFFFFFVRAHSMRAKSFYLEVCAVRCLFSISLLPIYRHSFVVVCCCCSVVLYLMTLSLSPYSSRFVCFFILFNFFYSNYNKNVDCMCVKTECCVFVYHQINVRCSFLVDCSIAIFISFGK